MSKQAGRLLASERVSVPALLELIPSELLERLAQELLVDKWVKKLKAEALFKLVLFSLFDSERLSLRVMQANTRDPFFRALCPLLLADEVTWVGLRERLIRLDPAFCRALYETIYEQAEALYGEKALEGYHIKRYDSTMIATFSHLLEGMRVGNTKQGKIQVKLTTELTDDFLLQMHFHSDQAHLSEETALKEAILQDRHSPDDIVVFDRGLKRRKSFAAFEDADIRFVGRLCAEPRYQWLHAHQVEEPEADSEQAADLELVQDSAVYLYESGKTIIQKKLRLIQYRCLETGQILWFVTNIWDLPASLIARVYRRRWDIEVLFRFMKQEMNLTHFVCNERNAIEVMLYFTMIAAMLVLIYKKRNGISSYKMAKIQFFKELTYSIVLDILESPEATEHFKLNVQKLIQRE